MCVCACVTGCVRLCASAGNWRVHSSAVFLCFALCVCVLNGQSYGGLPPTSHQTAVASPPLPFTDAHVRLLCLFFFLLVCLADLCFSVPALAATPDPSRRPYRNHTATHCYADERQGETAVVASTLRRSFRGLLRVPPPPLSLSVGVVPPQCPPLTRCANARQQRRERCWCCCSRLSLCVCVCVPEWLGSACACVCACLLFFFFAPSCLFAPSSALEIVVSESVSPHPHSNRI